MSADDPKTVFTGHTVIMRIIIIISFWRRDSRGISSDHMIDKETAFRATADRQRLLWVYNIMRVCVSCVMAKK